MLHRAAISYKTASEADFVPVAQEDWQDSTLLDRQTSSPTSDAQRKAEKIPKTGMPDCNACQVETDTLQPQSFSMFSTGSEACCTEASGQKTELKHAKKRVQLNSRLQGMPRHAGEPVNTPLGH